LEQISTTPHVPVKDFENNYLCHDNFSFIFLCFDIIRISFKDKFCWGFIEKYSPLSYFYGSVSIFYKKPRKKQVLKKNNDKRKK